MNPTLTIQLDASCDICGADFDPKDAVEVNGTSTCPCCSGDDRRTHGMDILSMSKRRR
jgi:predicted Zn-ribbon and HTH transcriptional regulator